MDLIPPESEKAVFSFPLESFIFFPPRWFCQPSMESFDLGMHLKCLVESVPFLFILFTVALDFSIVGKYYFIYALFNLSFKKECGMDTLF